MQKAKNELCSDSSWPTIRARWRCACILPVASTAVLCWLGDEALHGTCSVMYISLENETVCCLYLHCAVIMNVSSIAFSQVWSVLLHVQSNQKINDKCATSSLNPFFKQNSLNLPPQEMHLAWCAGFSYYPGWKTTLQPVEWNPFSSYLFNPWTSST